MQRLQWVTLAVGLSITTTSCATALGNLRLEGLEALSSRSESGARVPIEPHLRQLADAAEAEAIWLAAIEFTPEVNQIAVGLMQIVPMHTLDRGTAPGGWLVGVITLSMEEAVRYLGQSDDGESRSALWESEVLRITPLSEAYTGRPNHPLRSLEATS